MSGFLVVTATATGARHVARDLGNEDAVGTREDRRGVAAAVADGHSDPRCFRAATGSALGVRAALEEADAPAVVARWRAAVDQDIRRRRAAGDADRQAYGTTLIAARATSGSLAVVQIGDGDVVVVDRDGRARRLLDQEVDAGGITDSLSDDDAEHLARTAFLGLEDLPVLVLLSTDGIDNAYPHRDGLLDAAAELAELVRSRPAEELRGELDRWVRAAAATSGDDATAAVLALDPHPLSNGDGDDHDG